MSHNHTKLIKNRYSVHKTLGKGGMGIVYLVSDILKDNIFFALKTIRQDISGRSKNMGIEHFKNEYDIMTRLRHPNLTQVYDFGEDRDNYYIIMEYLQGKLISDLIKKSELLDIYRIFSIIVQVLRALEYIHSRNIIYRDIKPGNIMITENNVKLLDFGLSSHGKTKDDSLRGTVLYMAPELLSGNIGIFNDIFSLGIVFFELLLRDRFFLLQDLSINSIINILKNRKQYNNYQKNRLKHTGNKQIRDIIHKMTAYDPDKRYKTCSEIIEDINNICSNRFEFETDETKKSYIIGNEFSNRKKELESLHKALDNKDIKLFVCSGSVGIGKTRLYQEFKKYCSLNDILFFEANCIEGNQKLYHSIGDILKTMIIGSSRDTLFQYGRYLKYLLPGFPGLCEFAPIEIKGDPKGLKEIIMDNISDFILSFFNKTSALSIIYFNDLHWLDHGSSDIIKALLHKLSIDKYKDISLQIHGNINEKYLKNDHIKSLLMMDFVKKEIIHPLDLNGVSKYIENIFGLQNLHDSIRESIHQIRLKTGGNPFFLQELIKSMVENNLIIKDGKYWKYSKKIKDIVLPDNLMEILHTRIDKLLSGDSKRKHILKIMSLIRIDLSFQEMKNILGSIIGSDIGKIFLELERSEIIYGKDMQDGIYYFFNNILIKDIIKERIGNDSKLSMKLADALESSTQYYEEIAYHYEKGKNIEKAVEYYEKSGDIAQNHYFNEKAIRNYDQALNLLRKDTKKYHEISFRKSESLYRLDRIDDACRVLYNIKEIIIDKRLICKILNTLSSIMLIKGEYRLAKEYIDESFEIIKEIKDKELNRDTLYHLGEYYFHRSEFTDAILCYEQYKDLCNIDEDKKEYAMIMNSIGNIYQRISEYAMALDYYAASKKIAEKMNDKRAIAYVLTNIANVYKYQSKYDDALINFQRSIELFKEIGSKRGIGITAGNMGIIYLNQGNYKKAIECYKIDMDISEEIGDKKGYGIANFNMGNVYYYQGKLDIAIKCYEKYKNIIEEIGDKRGLSQVISNIGNIYFKQGKYQKSLECYEKYRETAEETGDKRGLGIAIGNLGNVYYSRGDIRKALKYFQRSKKIYEETGNKLRLANSLGLHGFVYFELGNNEKALKYIDEAIEIFQKAKVLDAFYISCNLIKSKIHLLNNDRENAKKANDHAIECARKLKLLDLEQKCRIQEYLIMALDNKEKAVHCLENILYDDIKLEIEAEVFYELYLLEKKKEYRDKAIILYKKLYHNIPNHVYKKRFEELVYEYE